MTEPPAKQPRRDFPMMKISEVYSSAKIENPDKSAVNLITVKTPGQLNGQFRRVVSSAHPNALEKKQILVKRIMGSTTITKATTTTVPPSQVGEALIKVQKQKENERSFQAHYSEMSRKSLSNPPVAVKPVAKPTQAVKDPKDAFIRQLQEQNSEMKKMLQEMRHEATQIQIKMRRWTATINDVLSRVQNDKIVSVAVNASPKPSPHLPKPVMKLTARKGTAPRNVIPFRSPNFPIKLLETMKQLEIDLNNNQYYELVFQRIMSSLSKVRIEKPATMLSYVLNTLIDVDLLGYFVWDAKSPVPDNIKPLFFDGFTRFQAFFSSLANAMSKICFEKYMDQRAVDVFLRSKIFTQSKIRHLKWKEQSQQAQAKPSQMVRIVRNLEKPEPPTEPPQPSTSSKTETSLSCSEDLKPESDSENENEKKIEWIDDDDNPEEVNDDDEMEETEAQKEEKPAKSPKGAESMLSEEDFEFLNC